jgi:hypothetical protein
MVRMSTQHQRRPDQALSAVFVRQIKKPGRHADGNGLYLMVEPSGAKRWVLRTVVHGRRRDIGLGSARLAGPRAPATGLATTRWTA